MKLIVDTLGKQVTVSRETVEKTEQNGRQKQERGTGRLMWSTQVFVLDDDGGEVITGVRIFEGRAIAGRFGHAASPRASMLSGS